MYSSKPSTGSSKSSEISISPFALPNFGYGWVNGTILKEVPSSLAIMTSQQPSKAAFPAKCDYRFTWNGNQVVPYEMVSEGSQQH